MVNGDIMKKSKKKSVKNVVKNSKSNTKSIDWSSIINIPNFVTSLRIILAPFIIYAILTEHYAAAFFLVLFAALTDSFDGKIARLLNKQTAFGAILDPIADVTLMVCTVIALLIQFNFPLWFGLIVLLREAIIILGGLLCVIVGVFNLAKADIVGKLSRFFQLFTVIIYILAYVQNYTAVWINVLMYFTAILTLISTVIYLSRAIELLKSWKKNK
jgi:cardiolipin synthase